MKVYRRYIIGIGLLLFACVLMFAYAKNAENVRWFYCGIEKLGLYDGYKYSTRNLIIWICLSVLIFALVSLSFYLLSSRRELFIKHPFLKALPTLILAINIGICLLSPRIDQFLQQFRHGLGGIMMCNRDNSLVGFLSYDSYGGFKDPVFLFDWESSGPVDESFFVKLVDIEDETKQYLVLDEAGDPIEMRMGNLLNHWDKSRGHYKARSTNISVEASQIVPSYKDTPENWRTLRYNVVIYNDKESKTFFFYYD